MPARKHNMFAIKLISVIVGIVSAAVTVASIDWGAVAKFGTSVNFLYDNHDELEHILDDYHTLLNLKSELGVTQAEVDSLGVVLANRDSLIHVLNLFNRGKMPYDSIWRLSESGHWYKTTVENHYKYEHND